MRPYCSLSVLKGGLQERCDKRFSRACSGRTEGSSFEQKEGQFRLILRKKFFMMELVRHMNNLPREVMDAPSLEGFKVRLGGALTNPL